MKVLKTIKLFIIFKGRKILEIKIKEGIIKEKIQKIMPTISEFFGIVIRMYWKDHKPPHFHAIYGEFEAEVDFENLEIINGDLPTAQERMVLEWAELHKEELRENWKLAENTQPLFKIPPLRR